MKKTNTGLVDYAKVQLGRPYWMGTFGQIATEHIYYYNKNRPDIAHYYTAADFPDQYGQRVHDCIGLIKGYIWSDTPESAPKYASGGCPDVDADTMLRLCPEQGGIGTIPDVPGVLVFFKGHIGVYIGGGEVIEARGHRYGVVQTKLSERGWKNWGKCPYISYETEEEEMVRYAKLSDIPDDWGARGVIETLMNAEIIMGDGSDPAGNNDVIDLSHDQVRSLVFAYRGGAFDRQLMAKGMSPAVQA